MPHELTIDRDAIARFCRTHYVTRLSLFGSVLTERFRPDSDVDVLVSFREGHVPGFLELYCLEQELSGILGGRKVDLVTEKALHARIQSSVLSAAQVQYAEG
jgi:predicted nucleotidyltransferase